MMKQSEGIRWIRTDANNQIFRELVRLLDEELAERDGEDHDFYAQFNTLEAISNVVLLMAEDKVVGCGAFKQLLDGAVEVKRMYVRHNFRNKGHAAMILKELELWARELGKKRCILETGLRQPEAIGLYQKCGYKKIKNFGPYQGVANSVCFEKRLI